MTLTNTRVVLAERPDGPATPDHFSIETEELGELEPDQVRVRVDYVSIDAAMRTRLHGSGFHSQVPLGETVLTHGVGRVIESTAAGWTAGDAVRGRLNAQTVATVPPKALEKIDDAVAPISAYLGALGGSTGVTAWIGVRCVAKPKPGDVFVVSAAAGAVGSVAGQIAKIDGARTIGIAGGPEKCAHVVDVLGYDHAVDYRNEDVTERLRELAPDGVNGFFDNVGGDVLDAVLDHLALRAKVTICGAISQYDDMNDITGPSMYLRLAERQSSMEGFAYFHFPEYFDEASADLARWLADGSLVVPEHVLEGIESFPDALQVMFSGGNTGKLLVKMS